MDKYILKLLIIDDKPDEREGLKQIADWASMGIEMAGEAENGIEGIEKARLLKPDIIITDIVMPKSDGLNMINEIRRFLPDVKVIFVSCFDNFYFAKSAINIDAMGYVLKPIIAGDLLAAVAKVTGIRIRELEKTKEEQKLRTQLNESIPLLKEQFIKDLIFGFTKDEKTLWDRSVFLETGFIPGDFIVFAVEIEDFTKKNVNISEDRKQLMLLEIKQAMSSFCRKGREYINFCISNINNFRYVIIANYNLNYILTEFDPKFFAEEIKISLNKSFEFKFTIGISSKTNQITDIYKRFQEACDALQLKMFVGKNQVINYTDIYSETNKCNGASIDLEEIHKKIKYLVITGQQAEIDDFVDKLFNIHGSGTDKIESSHIQYICLSVVYYLQITVMDMNGNFHDTINDDFNLYKRLMHHHTLLDIKHWLSGIIMTASSHINSKNSVKNRKIIDLMKNMIDEYYTKDLSVNDIASEACLSASYANYIFKKETGISLIEYLTNVRIEKAKELLRIPVWKVYEIAEMVGYKNNSYFCSVFKDRCGMTPLEYRERC